MSTPLHRPAGSQTRIALPALYLAHFSALGVFLPFLPVWLVARGIDGAALGLTLAAPHVVGIVAPILFGSLADALGLRARLLGFAALVALITLGCMGIVAAGLPAGDVRTLLLATLISILALARAPLFGLTDVLALETLGHDRARFGMLRLWGSAGFLLTAVLFPIAFDPSSVAALPVVMIVAYLATLVASRRLAQGSAKLGLDAGATLEMFAKHAAFFFAMFLWQLGNATYDATFTLHLTDLGVPRAWLGVAWGIGVVAEISMMALTPMLLARWRPDRLLMLGFLIAMSRWFLLAELRSPVLLLASQVLHAGSFALTWTIGSIELSRVARTGRLATAQGALATSMAVGSAIGMFIWPMIYREAGARSVFNGGGLVTLIAALIFGLLNRGSSYSRPSP